MTESPFVSFRAFGPAGNALTERQLHCQKCGYVWMPRIQTPKECPACKNRLWAKPKPEKEEE